MQPDDPRLKNLQNIGDNPLANRNGRPKGARNRSTIYREWLEKQGKNGLVVDDIVLAAIEKALAGDISALKELMDSAYGKVPDKQELGGLDGNPIEVRRLPDTKQFLSEVAGIRQDSPPTLSSPEQSILPPEIPV